MRSRRGHGPGRSTCFAPATTGSAPRRPPALRERAAQTARRRGRSPRSGRSHRVAPACLRALPRQVTPWRRSPAARGGPGGLPRAPSRRRLSVGPEKVPQRGGAQRPASNVRPRASSGARSSAPSGSSGGGSSTGARANRAAPCRWTTLRSVARSASRRSGRNPEWDMGHLPSWAAHDRRFRRVPARVPETGRGCTRRAVALRM